MNGEYLRVECKSCKHVTLFPTSILRGKSPHRPMLSTGEPCEAFLCPQCNHVSGHTADNLPTVLSGTQDQLSDPHGKSVTDVLIQCDGENCDTHIQVHVIAIPSRDEACGESFRGFSSAALKWGWDNNLRCGNNFPAWLPPKSMSLS